VGEPVILLLVFPTYVREVQEELAGTQEAAEGLPFGNVDPAV
jgi:hypothetical protein